VQLLQLGGIERLVELAGIGPVGHTGAGYHIRHFFARPLQLHPRGKMLT
jgi:hypothetical protein